ncbi:hypothetical protein PR202_gb25811 [Eleusine coracana subsp. coracana]|uniref:Uncharacterized protein n=1 Tax=Eleusine coracana subsp. coracana TaxID=191504 RepID=A0AAV5FMG5_ELECO|nr:hypothetical protein PR202_gb25775 [Eleusine coracana subsp. coracana]GJN36909.1 hypothetical protein PR202_gb25811 [Eleusine coracana subsp. coracana]
MNQTRATSASGFQTKHRPILPCLLPSSVLVANSPSSRERPGGREARRSAAMGFISFVGRVLFASLFLLSAYQEYAPSSSSSLRSPCPLTRAGVFIASIYSTISLAGGGLSDLALTIQVLAVWIQSFVLRWGEVSARFIEFGNDGGPAAKALKPKFNLFVKQVSKNTGLMLPHIDIKTVIAATMFLKGFGGLLFILSSSFGAILLLIYLVFITPIVYDFYNYEMESTQFVQLFFKFSQNLAFIGALLFFLGMKNSIPRRRSKGRTTKTKTN